MMNLVQESTKTQWRKFLVDLKKKHQGIKENEIELGRIREYQTWTNLWTSSALIPCWNHIQAQRFNNGGDEITQREREREKEREREWVNIVKLVWMILYLINICLCSLYKRNRGAETTSHNNQLSSQSKHDKWHYYVTNYLSTNLCTNYMPFYTLI